MLAPSVHTRFASPRRRVLSRNVACHIIGSLQNLKSRDPNPKSQPIEIQSGCVLDFCLVGIWVLGFGIWDLRVNRAERFEFDRPLAGRRPTGPNDSDHHRDVQHADDAELHRGGPRLER